MNKIKNTLSTKELKQFWDKFQANYSNNIENNLFPVMVSLCNLSNLTKKIKQTKNEFNILELSCGSGDGINYTISSIKNQENPNKNKINIYGTDISKNMLNAAYD